MEPWDGPAAIAFTDGRVIGATLDRNGLRPARYLVTKDDLLIMASETGVLPVKPEDVKIKGRLQPGKMLLVDLTEGRIVSDKEIKAALYGRNPIGSGSRKTRSRSTGLPSRRACTAPITHTIMMRQRAFGYTDEDLRMLLAPMAANGEEPVGSMGTDTPLACLSDKPQPLFNYFKQLFAQVTNPPIDPIREEMVMSLTSYIGTERNILTETPQHCHTLKLPHPDPDQSRSGKAAPRLAGRFSRHHAAHAVPRRRRREGTGARARRAVPPRFARHPIRLHAADSFRPRHGSQSTRPSPACWR